jgi:hypothetical protein
MPRSFSRLWLRALFSKVEVSATGVSVQGRSPYGQAAARRKKGLAGRSRSPTTASASPSSLPVSISPRRRDAAAHADATEFGGMLTRRGRGALGWPSSRQPPVTRLARPLTITPTSPAPARRCSSFIARISLDVGRRVRANRAELSSPKVLWVAASNCVDTVDEAPSSNLPPDTMSNNQMNHYYQPLGS